MAGVIADALKEPFVDAVTTKIEFLSRLAAKGKIKFVTGEENIKWPLRSAGNSSAGSYGEGDSTPAAGEQTTGEAVLAWKRNRVVLKSDNLARAVARGQGLVGFDTGWSMELEKGIADLLVEMESQLLSDGTGNSAKDITGILAALSDSNTYAGIAQGAHTYWQCSQQAASSAQVTWELIEQLIDTVEELQQPGQSVGEIWTSRTQRRILRDKYGDRMRHTAEGGKGQFRPSSVFIGDAEVVALKGYTNTRLDVVDPNIWEYHILLQPEEAEGNGWMAEELTGKAAFPLMVRPYGTGEDAKGVYLTVYSQLVCRWPRANGSLTGLATS